MIFPRQQSYVPEEDEDDEEMAEDDPVLAVTSVINITDKKVRGQHNITRTTVLQLSISQTKKVRGQHNITNTGDSF